MGGLPHQASPGVAGWRCTKAATSENTACDPTGGGVEEKQLASIGGCSKECPPLASLLLLNPLLLVALLPTIRLPAA